MPSTWEGGWGDMRKLFSASVIKGSILLRGFSSYHNLRCPKLHSYMPRENETDGEGCFWALLPVSSSPSLPNCSILQRRCRVYNQREEENMEELEINGKRKPKKKKV